jgi:leucyl/phenylalanyl-tRNA--protein transferase
MSRRHTEITPDLMLRAYRAGLFPMAEARGSARLYWLDPEMRGVLPLDGFHLPRRLARTVLGGGFSVTCDSDFRAAIGLCAAPAPGREETWINTEIEALFTALHEMGHAHSIEVWQGGAMVGGLYGVTLGGVFFGESMFSRVRDASKVALVHLVARLRLMGFSLLDTQFITGHLAQFGTVEIPRAAYKALLARAVDQAVVWEASPAPELLNQAIRGLRAPAPEDASCGPGPSDSR